MKFNIKYFIALLGLAVAFSSCIKDDVEPLGDKGTPMVSIQESPERVLYFSPFTGTKDIDLFTVIRDEVSSSAVNQSFSVTIAIDEALLDEYNEENETEFELLPDDVGQVVTGKGVESKGNGEYTVTFGPGITNVPFTVRVSGDLWDLAKTYGVFFTIKDSQGKTIKSGKDGIMAAIAIKNKYDGIYEVTGTMTDFVDPSNYVHVNLGLEPYGEVMQYELRTVGPNTCVAFDPVVFGDYIVPIATGGGAGLSGWGSFALVFEFDPETNDIISITNYYGQPAGNSRSAGLDPTGDNHWDPDSKTMNVKYFMFQPSVIPDAPHIRTAWDETWKYIGSR